jgi:alpha-amylase
MENVRAYVGGTGYGTGYHGYWVQNYYRVNAHFGNWEDVNHLSQQMHERGMRYIQDITLDHSNPLDSHVYGRLYESSDSDQIFINSYENDYDPFTSWVTTSTTRMIRAAKQPRAWPITIGAIGSCTIARWPI